jgi:hypothetical protein
MVTFYTNWISFLLALPVPPSPLFTRPQQWWILPLPILDGLDDDDYESEIGDELIDNYQFRIGLCTCEDLMVNRL